MLQRIQLGFKNHKYHRLRIGLLIVTLMMLVLIFFRVQAAIALRKRTNVEAIPIVAVITAQQEHGEEKIVLPGNVDAWHYAPIYARTNGYIKNWYVDIGSHVKAGDLLAEIETPELDAQARQAAADLNTAIANNKIAQITARRWLNLLKTQSVSQQEADEKVSTAKALEAAMIAAKANLDRLNELVSFQRVIAPFDGVITDRRTDIGALINAGSSTTAWPLFRIAQTDPLRIYVKIPQYYSARIKANMMISLHFAEHPNQEFAAKLVETAQAIDPKTRTLLAQFSAENKSGKLLPGAYTEVWFSLALPKHAVSLPVNALLFRAQGMQVAMVDKDDKIVLKAITISRDFGAKVEVASGVNPGERIVINPPDSILNGEKVRVVST